jgi:hypothetical protein
MAGKGLTVGIELAMVPLEVNGIGNIRLLLSALLLRSAAVGC